MLGITIGLGANWRAAAQITAERMSQTTGLRCLVLDDALLAQLDPNFPKLAHPSWVKAWLLDLFPQENEFLVFDADLLPRKPWNPEQIFREMNGAFCAVPDRNSGAVREECAKFNLPFPDWYVNGGLLMFSRKHKPVWDYVKSKHPEHGRWLEQTAINEALLSLRVEVARLPRTFNFVAAGPGEVNGQVNLHPAGLACDLASLQSLQTHYAPQPVEPNANLIHRPTLSRIDLAHTLPDGVGAEIGVFRGDFSEQLLIHAQPRKLSLVDRYTGVAASADETGTLVTEDMATMPARLRERFPDQPVQIEQGVGWMWLKRQPENSLDWVYLDSEHGHFNLYLELLTARRAVREGGIIAGHDYHARFPGVARAVENFCREFGLSAEIYSAEDFASYRIVNHKQNQPAVAKKPVKLFVALPVYGGLDPFFTQSLIKFIDDPPCHVQLRIQPGDSLVSRARNTLTAEFLESDCTHLLFIDTDLIFSSGHVKRIAEHPEEIVGGFYPKKQDGELNWVVNAFDNQPRPDGLQEVRYIGTGFIRVAREVFVRMALEYGGQLHYAPDHMPEKNEYDFWSVGTYQYADGSRRYLSEDWFFCQRALDLGYKVWADTRIVLKHVGTAVYPLKSQQKDIFANAGQTAGSDRAAAPVLSPPPTAARTVFTQQDGVGAVPHAAEVTR